MRVLTSAHPMFFGLVLTGLTLRSTCGWRIPQAPWVRRFVQFDTILSIRDIFTLFCMGSSPLSGFVALVESVPLLPNQCCCDIKF